MNDESDNELRFKINELVERLPASLVYNLLSEIEGMDGEPAGRVQLVRQYVIEHLNRQRTNRARRLFTTLFEAFLIDDEALYHAGTSVPGMIQRLDVGALWEVLSRDVFPLLAVEAQEKLDVLAQREIIDRAMRDPVAVALKERMRAGAVKHLDGITGNRKAMEELLAAMARNRPRRTRLLAAFFEKAPPVEAGTVQTMRDILAHADGPIRRTAEALARFPAPAGGGAKQEGARQEGARQEGARQEADRHADRLLDLTAELRERGPDSEAAALLLPLSVLNVKRNYAVVALYIRQSGVDPGKGDAVTAGLTAHFLGTLRALSAALTAVLRLNERVPGSAIRPSAKERGRIEALMDRLDELIEAVTVAGLMEDRRSEPAFRNGWGMAARIVVSRVAGIALERSAQAAAARRQPVSDHEDVVWLNRFLWRWQGMTGDMGYETYELVKWRDTLLEEMRANVERAMKFDDAEPLDDRMDHLLRIDALCGVFGQRVSGWISPTSHSMTRLLTHRLNGGGPSSPEETELVGSLLAAVRSEVGKSRYWKSSELMDLIELSDRKRAEAEAETQSG
ncbi:hypothetical protein [Azospirillum sp. SYSU D00513]|uniref:hypothetical protein n=1 Tax=Azospirillum sp. SYSU D00513 TaxID=2812561 RepID=UPI001A96CF05|nr:hypothetical protein [Azospirillum sp. SYSU D00513]